MNRSHTTKSAVSRPLPGVLLSQALKTYPSCFDAVKISVVEKYITAIDALPPRFRDVETLFLSNNSIVSLNGMQNFPLVKVLSIANNMIAAVEELEYLGSCTRLQILNLEFNAVTQVPNYRAHVIASLPQLRMLDNKEISAAERKAAVPILKKEETVLNLMYSNEVLIRKLEKGLSKMSMHDELRTVIYHRISALTRPTIPSATPFDTKKMLQLWQFDDNDEAERKAVVNHLRMEVRKAYNVRSLQRGDDKRGKGPKDSELWDNAFAEVMLAQQNRIANLLTSVETERQRSADMMAQLTRFDPKNIIGQLREQEEHMAAMRYQERDALVAEMRTTIRQLTEEMRSSDTTRAAEYEHKIRRLQQQIAQQMNQYSSPGPAEQPPPQQIMRSGTPQPRSGTPDLTIVPSAATPAEQRGRRGSLTKAPQPSSSTPAVMAGGDDDGETRPRRSSLSRTSRIPRPASASRIPQPRATSVERPNSQSSIPQPSTHYQPPPQQQQQQQQQQYQQQQDYRHSSSAPSSPQLMAAARADAPPPMREMPSASREFQSGSIRDFQREGSVPLATGGSGTYHHELPQPQAPPPQPQQQQQLQGLQGPQKLQRQVELLQRDIEQHVATEAMFQGINIQLRERLEVFQAQNKENVERAEAELRRLNDEMANAMTQMQSIQQRLVESESENSTLRQRLEQQSTQLMASSDVQLALERAEQDKRVKLEAVNRLQDEMTRISSERSHAQHAAEQYQAELKRVIALEQRTDLALELQRRNLQQRMFRLLRYAVYTQKHIRSLKVMGKSFRERTDSRMVLNMFATWRFNYQFRMNFERVRELRTKQRAIRCLRTWRAYSGYLRDANKREQQAVLLQKRWIKIRALQMWKLYHRRNALDPGLEATLTAKAVGHYKQYTRKVSFAAWRWWTRVTRRKQYEMTNQASKKYAARLFKVMWAKWIDSFALRAAFKEKLWRAEMLHNRFIVRRVMKRWRGRVVAKTQLQRTLQSGEVILAKRKRQRIFTMWKTNAKTRFLQRRKLEDASRLVEKRYFAVWKKFMLGRRTRKLQIRKLKRIARQSLLRQCVTALRAWRSFAAQAKRRRTIIKQVRLRLARTTLRRNMIAWLGALHMLTRTTRSALLTDMKHLQGKHDQERGNVTSVNLENLQLMDRIHALTQDVSQLQSIITEKDADIADLQRTVEEGVIVETSLRGELERKRIEGQSFQASVMRLHSNAQDNVEENVTTRAHHNFELQGQAHLVATLQQQLFEKQREIDEAHAAIADSSLRVTNTDRDNEAKLAQAFDIAQSLRELLDEKELQLANTAAENDQLRQQLADAQRRIMADTATLAQTVDDRDARIVQLQGAVSSLQGVLGDTTAALDVRAHQVRSLQVGMDLADQTQRRVRLDAVGEGSGGAASDAAARRPLAAADLSTSLAGYHYAQELQRQKHANELHRTALNLKEGELYSRDADFEARRSRVEGVYADPSAPGVAARAVSASSAPQSQGLQGQIDELRQRIMNRLQTPPDTLPR